MPDPAIAANFPVSVGEFAPTFAPPLVESALVDHVVVSSSSGPAAAEALRVRSPLDGRLLAEAQAIAMANDSPFGLHASVWTRNRARGERLARRLHAGGVYVNDCLAIHSVPALPTGGLGESGFGRVHGIAGLEEMLRPRAILVDRIGLRREPWWFPYSPKATRLLSALLAGRGAGFVRGAREALRRLAGRAG